MNYKDFFTQNFVQGMGNWGKQGPFDHVVIDDFLQDDIAHSLSNDFPSYDSPAWLFYDNQIENKKTSNNWYHYPPLTYKFMSYLNSESFISELSQRLNIPLKPDIGVHGGGWHIHANGGNLNPHRDYSIHPKLDLQRKLNLIIYLSSDLLSGMGGELGLWSHDETNNCPADLVEIIEPKFNRAVLFDTTQNSWHGLVSQLSCPNDVFRKSIAVYYLCEPSPDADLNERAVFSPRTEQKNDEEVLSLIEKRQK